MRTEKETISRTVRMERSGSNPNGVPYLSPGLARGTSAYPGLVPKEPPTPTGLRHCSSITPDATPLGVEPLRSKGNSPVLRATTGIQVETLYYTAAFRIPHS
jgi:hypothetical protein